MEILIENEMNVYNKKDNYKFRIFNLKTKTFYYDNFFISSDGEVVLDEHGNKLNLKENIIQRCVGKKDIKGNLIYHGDLLRTDESGWKAFVVWSGGGFYLIDKYGGYSNIPNWEKCEIIGNMFTFNEDELYTEEQKNEIKFWYSCWNGDEDKLIKLLPSCKKYINKNIKYKDEYLSLPLIAAINSENPRCVEILLDNGAKINKKCKNLEKTPLEWAEIFYSRKAEILSLILNKK